MKVDKTQVCEKYIKEIDEYMEFLKAMRKYCESQLWEAEAEECGRCCDAINDPDNRRQGFAQMREQARKQQKAQQLEQLRVMESKLKKNLFLNMDGNVDFMNGIMEHYNEMEFPEGAFTKKPKQGNGWIVIRERDMTPELMKLLSGGCLYDFWDLI